MSQLTNPEVLQAPEFENGAVVIKADLGRDRVIIEVGSQALNDHFQKGNFTDADRNMLVKGNLDSIIGIAEKKLARDEWQTVSRHGPSVKLIEIMSQDLRTVGFVDCLPKADDGDIIVEVSRLNRVQRLLASCLTIWLASSAANAAALPDYVALSDAAFAVLECSVFAAHARNGEEKRLFAFGLEKTRTVIEAARAGRVSKEDYARMNFVWPIALRAWNFEPQDTSTEFVAGQIYDMIWSATTSDLGQRTKDRTYQAPAVAEFASHNCSLIAR
jgi:hypothetical protein